MTITNEKLAAGAEELRYGLPAGQWMMTPGYAQKHIRDLLARLERAEAERDAARAENAELVRENKRLDREWQAAESTASTLSKRVEELEAALRKAREFIVNGTEFGFIRMPAFTDDPAHLTLPAIERALTGGSDG